MFKSASVNTASPKSANSSLFQSDKSEDAFVQPKLTVGKPNDRYEVEANRVADQVVAKNSENSSYSSSFFSPAPLVQHQVEESDNEVQQNAVAENITPISLRRQDEETSVDHTNEIVQSKSETQNSFINSSPDNNTANTDIQKQEEEVQEKEEGEEAVQEKSFLQRSKELSFSNTFPDIQKVNDQQPGGSTGLSVESRLNSSKGGGSPLPDGAKNKMESGFGSDFSNVRVHTDSNAVQMSKDLGAQAFTHGNDIYFNEGKYDTSSTSGQHLLAHELTHTVQQNGSVQKKPEISQTSNNVQLLPDFIASRLNEYARYIPGYTLLTIIIGYNPILGESVQRTPTNIVEGLLELVPVWGVLLVNKLREYNALQTAFDWIEGELSRLNITTSRIESLINEAWDDMDFVRLDPFEYNKGVLIRTFRGLYNDVVSFADSLTDQVLGFIKEAVVSPLVGFLEANSPTYVLATKVLGRKFPLDEEVNAPTVEILEDFLILIGKETEVEEMRNKGTLQETADWIDTQLITFFSLLGRFNALFTRAWNAFSLENLRDIPAVFSGILTDFTDLLQDFLTFAAEVAAKVLEIIKNALLEWLSSFADDIPGFHLLTVIIRRNPFTGEAVARTTENIIRGFMGLVPGGEAKFQELQQTGVVTSAAQRIDALIARLGISVAFIVQLFTDVWNSVSIEDLISPIETFQRIAAQFGEPISRLFTFVVEVVKILIELILAMMNFPTDLIVSIITNAMQAFNDIKRDPVAFLLNLIGAVKQGFVQFFNNIVNHLLGGLQKWLFGELGEAGITPPSEISFQSILGMSLEILGITVDNILERLALKIGQDKVDKIRAGLDMLTGIWTFVKDVIERGPIAIWEYIQEKISDLWNIILDGIKNWIMTRIVASVTTKLLSMLDPTGIMAVVNSAIAFFNAVQSFIEKLREMLEILNSFVVGVAEIARGSISNAANYLESALADSIPVAISFLARQVGLGGLGARISEMIELARAKINEGIDWLIDKAMAAGTAFLNMLGLGGGEEGAEEAEGEEGGLELSSVESTFKDSENEDHRLYIIVQGINATIMMASDNPGDLQPKIQNKQNDNELETPEEQAQLSTAEHLRGQLITLIESHLANDDVQDIEGIRSEIQTKLDAIRDAARDGKVADETEIPETEVTHGLQRGKAKFVKAYPLTNKSGNTVGSDPSEDPPGWAHVRSFDLGIDKNGTIRVMNWVRFHLLHNLKMHGPGVAWNLVPSDGSDNSRYYSTIESTMVDELTANENGIYAFEVTVNKYRKEEQGTDYMGDFPESLTVNAEELQQKDDGSFSTKRAIFAGTNFDFNVKPKPSRAPGAAPSVIIAQSGRENLKNFTSLGDPGAKLVAGTSASSVTSLSSQIMEPASDRNNYIVRLGYLRSIRESIGDFVNTNGNVEARVFLFSENDPSSIKSALTTKINHYQRIADENNGASLNTAFLNAKKKMSAGEIKTRVRNQFNVAPSTFDGYKSGSSEPNPILIKNLIDFLNAL